jgi:hypothetical protein
LIFKTYIAKTADKKETTNLRRHNLSFQISEYLQVNVMSEMNKFTNC